MNKNRLLKKGLVISIMLLFIGMCIPSTGNIVEDAIPCNIFSELVGNSSRKIAYGYCLRDTGELVEGPVTFSIDDPENITQLWATSSSSPMTGGTWTWDGWYCCEYGSGDLWTIDWDSGYMVEIGGGGVHLNGLTWSSYDSTFGSSNTSLYKIDEDTGEQTLIGSFDLPEGRRMGGIGYDYSDNILYGIEYVKNNLYMIDIETGEAALIGPLGIEINGVSEFDMAPFDWNFYLSTFTTQGELYTIDTDTGECTLIGEFQDGAEISALTIPDRFYQPTANFSWSPQNPCAGETIVFNASSSQGYQIALYEWDWDNDLIFDEKSTNPITSHMWDDEGSYPVTLLVHDKVGRTDTQKYIVRIGGLAYGFCDDPYDELDGVVVFNPDDPANLTIIKPGTWDISSGGCFVPPHYLYFTQYHTGMLSRLDLETLEFEIIGGGGTSLNGLAYDPVNEKLYGASGSGLYIIDLETGEQEFVGSFGVTSLMIAIAFDAEGALYAWAIMPDALYTVDIDTGEATVVGSLVINIGGGDGAFDYETDNLYLAAYTAGGYYLYECDEDTGECTLIGEFQNSAVVIPLIIPYNFSNKYPIAKFTWKPTPPEPGETTLFNASASYDPDGYIALYEWDWDNDGIFDESHTSPMATHSWPDYGFYPVALRITDNSSINGTTTKIVRVGNRPPDAPIITGQIHGKVGVEYEYNFSLSDPDDDSMYLRIDWGNGTGPWQGPYDSDTKVRLNHTWNQKGTYTIQAQAIDSFGMKSDWATLEVTMPKGHPSIADDGTIYFPSTDDYLYALYPNGTLKWKSKTGWGAGSSVAIGEGTLYIAVDKLYAIYPNNGTKKWTLDVGRNDYTSPAISADGTIYVSADKSLVAVNPDGTEKWRREISNLDADSM